MSKKLSIPTANFRVLLIQMIIRLTYRLGRTLLPNSKRHDLLVELQEVAFKLERHLKRNIKIKRSSIVKKSLWDAFYSKVLPEWLEVDYVDCLREEQCKDLKMTLKDSKMKKKDRPKVVKSEKSNIRELKSVIHSDIEPGRSYVWFSHVGHDKASYIGVVVHVLQTGGFTIEWPDTKCYQGVEEVLDWNISGWLDYDDEIYEHPDEDYTKALSTKIKRRQGKDYPAPNGDILWVTLRS